MLKTIAFGEILIDFLSDKLTDETNLANETFTKFPGGAPANVAAAVAKLGGDSYFVGKVAQDSFGKFLEKSLFDMGVKTEYIKYTTSKKTALAFVSLDNQGERSFEFYREETADLDFHSTDFDQEWFTEPGIFHICSNTLTDADIAASTLTGQKMAVDAYWLVSFDVNLRLNLWKDKSETRKRIWDCIKLSHIIKLSKEELEYMCDGQNKADTINKMLNCGALIVIITDASNTLRYYMNSGSGEVFPPNAEINDSTAAGDAFVGGLLYSFAKANMTRHDLNNLKANTAQLNEILYFACCCGAFAVTRKGAFTALANLEDLNTYMSSNNND